MSRFQSNAEVQTYRLIDIMPIFTLRLLRRGFLAMGVFPIGCIATFVLMPE